MVLNETDELTGARKRKIERKKIEIKVKYEEREREKTGGIENGREMIITESIVSRENIDDLADVLLF